MAKQICRKCNKEKELKEFYKHNSNLSGRDTKCKLCVKEDKKDYAKKYREKTKEYQKEYHKKYREQNKEKRKIYIKKHTREYKRKRRQNEPLFRLKANLRTRVYQVLRGNKSKRSQELLGADIFTIKNHLENQFTEGMTWQNYGEWHVDHKIPLSSAESQKEVEKLFHYTNLQPLWAEDNLKKSNKIC